MPAVYKVYPAALIRVIEANEFDIKLIENDIRFHGKLKVSTPPDASKQVIRYLNQIKQPKIVFLEKKDDFWYIDIQVVAAGGMETTLTKWLRENHLAWDGLPTSGL